MSVTPAQRRANASGPKTPCDPLGPVRTQDEVAREMKRRHGVKMTRNAVYKTEKRALRKLREALGELAREGAL